MTPWQRVASTTVVQDRWMHLRADHCQLPDGQAIAPYYVIDERDWANVFAHALHIASFHRSLQALGTLRN